MSRVPPTGKRPVANAMEAELKQFNDFAKQEQTLRDQMAKLQLKINEGMVRRKRAEAAIEEINALPEGREAYKQIGRAFVCEPRETLKENFQQTIDQDLDLKKLLDVMGQMEAKMKDVQKQGEESKQRLAALAGLNLQKTPSPSSSS